MSKLIELMLLLLSIWVLAMLPSQAVAYSNSVITSTTSGASSSLAAKGSALFAESSAAALSTSSRDAATKLPGTFWKGARSFYELDFDWIVAKNMGLRKRIRAALQFFFRGGFLNLLKTTYALYTRKTQATIYDARAKEAEEGLSKADFFDKYGFVILNHTSAMEASDWEQSDRNINELLKAYSNRTEDGGAAYQAIMNDFRNGDTPVKQIYAPETEALLRTILPRAKKIMPPARGIRRYMTSNPNKGPAKQVHNDYGLDFEAVVDRNPFFDFDKQKAQYEASQADEYMLVNLWRPVKPMSTPCRSLPLSFLDSSTLHKDDFVTIDSASLGVITALRDNPNHKFYYYPDMTVDEVVVFKQFHQLRNESSARMPVFHTAFADPAADESTEGRVSYEYRVGLLL